VIKGDEVSEFGYCVDEPVEGLEVFLAQIVNGHPLLG
jgi:hypothetical protein